MKITKTQYQLLRFIYRVFPLLLKKKMRGTHNRDNNNCASRLQREIILINASFLILW